MPDGIDTHGASPAAADPSFVVVARIDGIREPLLVAGAPVAYTDFETALEQAVRFAIPPRHDNVLTVELVHAEADYQNTRLTVSLVMRATLRTRLGDTFVAQKQFVCHDGAIVDPAAGGPVIWSCITRLAQDLGGWLEGLPE
jgi:hypothetical protein